MKAKDKRSLAVGIVLSVTLAAVGIVLAFCLSYYLFPSHPWMLANGAIDEVARMLAYENAITIAFTVGAVVAGASLLLVLARALWLAFGQSETEQIDNGDV